MRVLHVITGLGVGGAEDQVVHLARESSSTVEVACLSAAGHGAERLVALGVRVLSIPGTLRYDVPTLVRLARLMRSRRYDVVHTHLFRAGLYGQVAARAARVPAVLYTEHTLGRRHIEELHPTGKVRALYRVNGRLADAVVAVSPWVAERVQEWGVPAGKVVCIPNGLDLPRWRFDPAARTAVRRELGIPEDARVIGMVGRMIPRKQHLLLLRAASPLLREGAWLVLVGDGPARADVEREVRYLGIGDRTVLAGLRHDVPSVLSAVDAFASLAAEEMFGLAPIEALASGLPVVITHSPPLDGVVDPRILRVSHEPRAVQASLRRALDATHDRTVPPAVARRYDARRTAARIDELHATLLARRRAVVQRAAVRKRAALP